LTSTPEGLRHHDHAGPNTGIVRRLGHQRANRLPRGPGQIAEQFSIPQEVSAEDLKGNLSTTSRNPLV
jgi:hypothetical protein